MLWNFWIGLLALLLRHVSGVLAADVTVTYRDPDTGLTFAGVYVKYQNPPDKGIWFRIATPSDAQQYTSYDMVVQFVCPNDIGWAGMGFGGSMTRNPLAVAWKAGNTMVVSSRWANGHLAPRPNTGADIQILKAGTKSNSTHWQVTMKCRGCSKWSNDLGERYVNPRGQNRFAMASAWTFKISGTSNTTDIIKHDVHSYWDHQVQNGANTNFATTFQTLA